MKATGVVRRIDDLGRIVIPKEIRRNLRIREGDSLEIFTDGHSSITFRKYSPVESINDFIFQYVEALNASSKKDIIITDTEKIVAVAGTLKKDLIGKKISLRLDDLMQKRTLQVFEKGEGLEIVDKFEYKNSLVMKPITVYGDVTGCVIILGDNRIDEVDKALVETSATFLGKYLES